MTENPQTIQTQLATDMGTKLCQHANHKVMQHHIHYRSEMRLMHKSISRVIMQRRWCHKTEIHAATEMWLCKDL